MSAREDRQAWLFAALAHEGVWVARVRRLRRGNNRKLGDGAGRDPDPIANKDIVITGISGGDPG